MIIQSCNQQHNSFNKESVIKEVKSMFDGYHSDIRASGLTAEFKYLDNSNDFFWVPPGYTSSLSYDSVRAILENNSKGFIAVDFNWETLQVIPLSDEIATYTGIAGGIMTDTLGVKSPVRIIESGVVIKRNEGWKLLCGQSAALETDRPDSQTK